MAQRNLNTPSTPEIMATLAWMRSRNIKPVPLHRGSKAALNKDYASPNYNPPPDSVWQNQSLNIGAVLGPVAGGPIDIDLDCREALFFADKFLPPTPAVFGRKSKPSSHYIYRFSCSEYAKVAFTDPTTLDTIIEIRADGGHQSVFPGSTHQGTGELIEWAKVPFPDIPVLDEKIVTMAARKIAIATLIVRHMWHSGSRNDVNKHLAGIFYNLEWPIEDTLHLIEQVQIYDGENDQTRYATIKATYKKGEAGGKVTGAPSLRKLLRNAVVVDKILEWAGSTTINLMNEYNERFAIVDMSGKFRIVGFPESPADALKFYGDEDFLKLHMTDRVTVGDKDIPRAKIWLNSPNRKQYAGMDFYPGGGEPNKCLNLWQGWGVEPDAGGDCSAWLQLLRDVICGGDDLMTRWLLAWFAAIVREPMRKAMTSPVIIGEQGAGKSLLVAYFGRIMPQNFTVATNSDHITGKFNRHLATTLLLHADEALFGGDQKHRGVIYSLVTDESRLMESKGVDTLKVKNHIRLILTSNHDNAAPSERDDRRFTIFKMENRRAPPELVSRVVAEMQGNGPAALMNHLLTMEYDERLPRSNIKSDDLMATKELNFSPIEAWWLETLMTGVLLPDSLRWAQKETTDNWPSVVSLKALYIAYIMYATQTRSRHPLSSHGFARAFKRLLGNAKLVSQTTRFQAHLRPDDAPDMVKNHPEVVHAYQDFPPLDHCRAVFEKYVETPPTWPQPMIDEEKRPWEKI